MKNQLQHFLDETLGSGFVDNETSIVEQGNYLCVRISEHPVHIYQAIEHGEQLHPSIEQVEHNGRSYKLAWIEDDRW